jgi:glycosyltransferase involved in cell wall biosynthesis
MHALIVAGSPMSKLTVVVPAYNESEGLRDFHARLAAVLD